MYSVKIDTSSTQSTLVAAPSSTQAVAVYGFSLESTSAGGAVTSFQSGTSGTVLHTCGSTSVSGGGESKPLAYHDAYFTTAPGEGLVLNIASAVRITGSVQYTYIPLTVLS
jgi:hypothetical protein